MVNKRLGNGYTKVFIQSPQTNAHVIVTAPSSIAVKFELDQRERQTRIGDVVYHFYPSVHANESCSTRNHILGSTERKLFIFSEPTPKSPHILVL